MEQVMRRLKRIRQSLDAYITDSAVWKLECGNGKTLTYLRRDRAEQLQKFYGGKISLM